MSEEAVAISSIGMVTPVGLRAHNSCAAIRANISRMIEFQGFSVKLESLDEVPLMACPIKGLTDGYVGLGRWTRMAVSAIRDLTNNSGLSTVDLSRASFYVGLPNLDRCGLSPEIGTQLGIRIGQWVGARGLGASIQVYKEGNAAAVLGLQAAIRDLHAGDIAFAVVGGVDSLLQNESLEVLLESGRLKTDDNVDSLIPGEAAAFILLETLQQAEARGAQVLATLEAPSTARESRTIWGDETPDGTGLSEAIGTTLDRLDDRGTQTGLVICDLNGETYRAKEFAISIPRVLGEMEAPWALWHPADCIGDSGAASTILAACVGARALSHGYADTDAVLVWASSDDGLRGSFYLRRYVAGDR